MKDLIVADCSTAQPDSTVKLLAVLLEPKGVRLVDTPLTRTPKEAEAGKLGMMTGGDEALLNEIRPVLSCFADTIIHAGPIGAGHRLKLINNFLSLSHAAIAAEAIAVAAKAGVSMKALKDIVVAGGANSAMFERIIKVPLEEDDSAAKFAIRNARKDLRYYTAMAEEQASALIPRRTGATTLYHCRKPGLFRTLCAAHGGCAEGNGWEKTLRKFFLPEPTHIQEFLGGPKE